MSSSQEEQGRVRTGCDEAELDDECREPLEPGPRRLSKPVQGLVEEVDGVGAISVDEADGLLTVDLLFDVFVQEGIGDIKLFGLPIPRGCDSKDSTNGCRFDDRCKCFTEVDTSALSEAADNPTGFIAL